jgi:hypothetical protein
VAASVADAFPAAAEDSIDLNALPTGRSPTATFPPVAVALAAPKTLPLSLPPPPSPRYGHQRQLPGTRAAAQHDYFWISFFSKDWCALINFVFGRGDFAEG